MEKIKTCSKCNQSKFIDEFHKAGKDRLKSHCKLCRKVEVRIRYENNKEKILKQTTEWQKNNPEKAKQYRKTNYKKSYSTEKRRAQYNKYRDKIKANANKRLREDKNFRLKTTISKRLSQALKGQVKSGSTIQLLGISIKEYRDYLQSKFLDGMTWENYGLKGWHIDHIIPLSAFDLTKEEEQKIAFHYINTQPMWGIDNIKKSNKLQGNDHASVFKKTI